MPLAMFSNPIAPAIAQFECPIAARPAKLRLEIIIRMRLISTERFMPRREYIAPPMKMPMR